MAELLKSLSKRGIIRIPDFITPNTQYLTMMGSVAYGVSSESSDIDVYGFCVPEKEVIFPHLAGEIEGFGRQKQRFDQWQQHHCKDEQAKKEYDFSIYNIVKYFQLCMENNPNMIDSLFVPQFAILHCTEVGNMVRENRKLFLHKGCWFKFKGYAYSQLHKIKTKNPIGKRKEYIIKDGIDWKFSYHLVRLLNECEQILTEGDLDLIRNREQLKSIRRGEWSLSDVETYFNDKEKQLEKLYNESKLQHSPDEKVIKKLLLNCLEHHYGSLNKCVVQLDKYEVAINEIKNIIKSLDN